MPKLQFPSKSSSLHQQRDHCSHGEVVNLWHQERLSHIFPMIWYCRIRDIHVSLAACIGRINLQNYKWNSSSNNTGFQAVGLWQTMRLNIMSCFSWTTESTYVHVHRRLSKTKWICMSKTVNIYIPCRRY